MSCVVRQFVGGGVEKEEALIREETRQNACAECSALLHESRMSLQ